MNNYVKMSASSFVKSLEAGKYDTLTGARRAIGKSSMTEADKKKAHKAADEHFEKNGEAAPRAKKPAVVKAPRAVKAPVAAAPTPPRTPRVTKPAEPDTHATIQATTTAMEGLANAKRADPTVDVREPAQTGANILSAALGKLSRAFAGQSYTNGVARPAADEASGSDHGAEAASEEG